MRWRRRRLTGCHVDLRQAVRSDSRLRCRDRTTSAWAIRNSDWTFATRVDLLIAPRQRALHRIQKSVNNRGVTTGLALRHVSLGARHNARRNGRSSMRIAGHVPGPHGWFTVDTGTRCGAGAI